MSLMLQLCIIFDNSVVYHRDLVGTVHVRVSIDIIGNTVRCPAGMSNSNLSFKDSR